MPLKEFYMSHSCKVEMYDNLQNSGHLKSFTIFFDTAPITGTDWANIYAFSCELLPLAAISCIQTSGVAQHQ